MQKSASVAGLMYTKATYLNAPVRVKDSQGAEERTVAGLVYTKGTYLNAPVRVKDSQGAEERISGGRGVHKSGLPQCPSVSEGQPGCRRAHQWRA